MIGRVLRKARRKMRENGHGANAQCECDADCREARRAHARVPRAGLAHVGRQSRPSLTPSASEVNSGKKPLPAVWVVMVGCIAILIFIFMQLRPTLRACSGTISQDESRTLAASRCCFGTTAPERPTFGPRVGLPMVSPLWHNGSQLLECPEKVFDGRRKKIDSLPILSVRGETR